MRETPDGNRLLSYEERIALKQAVAAKRAEQEAITAEIELVRNKDIRRRTSKTAWKKRFGKPKTWEGSLKLNRAQAQALHQYFISKPWSQEVFEITEQRGDGEVWATSPWGELVVIPRTGGYRVVAEGLEGGPPILTAINDGPDPVLDLDSNGDHSSNGSDG